MGCGRKIGGCGGYERCGKIVERGNEYVRGAEGESIHIDKSLRERIAKYGCSGCMLHVNLKGREGRRSRIILTGLTSVFTDTIVPRRQWRMNMVIVASLSMARTITTSSESDVSATGNSCISEL